MQSNRNSLEEVSLETALKVIKENHGAIKTVPSPLSMNAAWLKILPQLADPKHNRPVKKIDENEIDRSRAYHPKLNIWETKIIKDKRGSPKETIFTKKTDVTLIPTDGKIHLFTPILPKYQDTVAMLFDLRQCDLKNEKYIFPTNANNNKKWWLKRKKLSEDKHEIMQGISLKQLKNTLAKARKNNIILKHNDILAGLSKASLVGIVATKNELFARLNALTKQNLVKKKLKKQVPLLIITPKDGVIIYTKQQQLRDLQNVLRGNKNDPLRKMIENEVDQDLLAEALHTLPRNQHFLASESIPEFIKEKVLDYFDFVELAKYAHGITPNAQNSQAPKNLLLEKFHTLREIDFKNLINELKVNGKIRPLTKELLQALISTEIYTFSQIERAIIHFCFSNPKEANEVLSDYLTETFLNSSFIKTFIMCGAVINLNRYEKTIVSIESEEGPWGQYRAGVRICVKWSGLISAILCGDDELTKLILNQYSSRLTEIIHSLNELVKHASSYPDECKYSLQKVTKAKTILSRQLKSHPDYLNTYQNKNQLSYEDKRIIEKELLTEIQQLSSKQEVRAFYSQNYNSLYFQARHPCYDSIIQKRFTQIKENVLTALQKQSFSLPSDKQILLKDEENKQLNDLIAELRSILESKRDELEKQRKGFSSLFYSSILTELKYKSILVAIKDLEKINNMVDFRLLTESLLCNKYITDKRSISLTSDTYVKLNGFYTKHFASPPLTPPSRQKTARREGIKQKVI